MTPRRAARAPAALALAALLAACASGPVREAPPVPAGDALATQVAREAALRADPAWSLVGRVALANGGRGGSGRLEWRQQGDAATVSLSAPITRQSWRLRAGPGGATLEGLEGGPRQGPDASVLLQAHTGWQIPVAALPAWLRGARAPHLGDATLAFGADGRLARMEQGGWTIVYSDWRLPVPQPGGAVPATGAAAGGHGVALPHRMEAVRGDARVRLVVDAWGPGAAAD